MSSGQADPAHPGPNGIPKVPKLDGPDEYHVYTGCCDADASVYNEIKTILSGLGYTHYQNDQQLARSDNIELGIDKSRNILFLVSPSYMRSDWCACEIQHAIEKAEVRGNGSVLVVMCGVSESQISRQLRGFNSIEYRNEDTWKDKLHKALSEEPLRRLAYLKKDNFGAALAYSYFYGFLKFVLPELAPRIRDSGMQNDEHGRIMSHKMFIVIPESCRAPTDLCLLDANLKSYSWIQVKASRAGVKGRQYNIPMYEFTDAETERVYRIVIEIATPVATLLEMYNDKVCGLTETERTKEVRRFYYHVNAMLTQGKYSHLGLHNRASILYYKDMKSTHEHFGEMLLRRVKEEIHNEVLAEAIQDDTGHSADTPVQGMDIEDNLVTVEVASGDTEHAILNQELLQHYPLNARPRGMAIIINNMKFDHLSCRNGADKDQNTMRKLFNDLHFDVDQFENQTAGQMKDIVAQYASRDYGEDVQAFACCIMSHGRLGQLFGTDGSPVSITKITEKFTVCPSLRHKPKIFFIQACQGGEPEEPGGGAAHQGDGATESDAALADETAPVVPKVGAEVGATEADAVRANRYQSDLVPSAPDFLMSYATLPGTFSYRIPERGAFYINALDAMIRQWSMHMPLDRILMKVTEDVKTQYDATSWDQYPFHLHTTDKLIYLKFN